MFESNEEYIRKIVREELNKFLSNKNMLSLNEGVDINVENKTISFNAGHQNNVDTNDYIHPHIITNNVKGETVLSMFERKDNEEGNDGNPLVYALKGIRGWRFENPNHDIMALMKRFISVCRNLQTPFDTLIIIPSNNELNRRVFSYLVRLISFETSCQTFFRKLTVDEVYERFYDEEYFETIAENEHELKAMRKDMNRAFRRMNKENNGIFSYKYINCLMYRDAIEQSLAINFDYDSTMQYRNIINDKNILVFDDTVATGHTISDSAKALRETFSPASITFLTLFSPKTTQGFSNTKIHLT